MFHVISRKCLWPVKTHIHRYIHHTAIMHIAALYGKDDV